MPKCGVQVIQINFPEAMAIEDRIEDISPILISKLSLMQLVLVEWDKMKRQKSTHDF